MHYRRMDVIGGTYFHAVNLITTILGGLIYDVLDFQRHVDNIHFNPVKHGYVKNPIDWKYSTIHQHIKKGKAQPNWGNQQD